MRVLLLLLCDMIGKPWSLGPPHVLPALLEELYVNTVVDHIGPGGDICVCIRLVGFSFLSLLPRMFLSFTFITSSRSCHMCVSLLIFIYIYHYPVPLHKIASDSFAYEKQIMVVSQPATHLWRITNPCFTAATPKQSCLFIPATNISIFTHSYSHPPPKYKVHPCQRALYQ